MPADGYRWGSWRSSCSREGSPLRVRDSWSAGAAGVRGVGSGRSTRVAVSGVDAKSDASSLVSVLVVRDADSGGATRSASAPSRTDWDRDSRRDRGCGSGEDSADSSGSSDSRDERDADAEFSSAASPRRALQCPRAPIRRLTTARSIAKLVLRREVATKRNSDSLNGRMR